MTRNLQWFNEPEEWKTTEPNGLKLKVTGKTDYWRITHYGFTVDDGPFYYADLGGEFEMKVKITGTYRTQFDQMGLMLRKDEKTWIKAGVEYVDGIINLSAVVTHTTSDWSMVEMKDGPEYIWIKIERRLDAVKLYYSLDDKNYHMYRMAYFPAHVPVMAGMVAASPDGAGFDARFEHFEIRALPDTLRQRWLENNDGVS